MVRPIFFLKRCILALWIWILLIAQCSIAEQKTNLFEIQSVEVDSNPISMGNDGQVDLGTLPKITYFHYGPSAHAARSPIRLRDRLVNYEKDWKTGISEMSFTVRFYNKAFEQIDQIIFKVHGESAGWTGSLKTSPLAHREEMVTVPGGASFVMAIISSAGPPDAKGVYVVANLTISKVSSNLPPVVVIGSPVDLQTASSYTNQNPSGWIRDGTRASMAKIVDLESRHITNAFAVIDDDSVSHAEWHNVITEAPKVVPGDKLFIAWNEMFSIGDGGTRWDRYEMLPPGNYTFQVQEVDVFGLPTGYETSIKVLVSTPFWKTNWFWTIILTGVVAVTFGTGRYITWYKMRHEIQRLQSQQTLERERLRIARDIHDDLGARVTEISLLSAMSQADPSISEPARANFAQISQMSREMVSALYETVWAVNPENDNLSALGDNFCQIVNQLCGRAQFPCCIHMKDLPREVPISSQTRHNVSMVLKEAVNNAIKHAKASKLELNITFADDLLNIAIQDDGCGFQPRPDCQPGGNGLGNMQRRMVEIGGKCVFESKTGQGTTVRISLPLGCLKED